MCSRQPGSIVALALVLSTALACSSDDPSQDRGSSGGGGGAVSLGGAANGGSSSGNGGSDPFGFGNTDASAPELPDANLTYRDAGNGLLDEEGDCGGTEVKPEITMEVIPGNILLIFDKSGSMDDPWDVTQNRKYRDAEAAITAALMPLVDNIRVGAVFFPDQPSGGDCAVPPFTNAPQIDFMDGADFLMAWMSYWQGNPSVNGRTPLLEALTVADQALMTAPTDGVTNVVIITDGAPNCTIENDDLQTKITRLTAQPAQWLTQGIQTYVLGLPGAGDSDAVAILDAVAAAGGTTMHLVPTDPTALQTELAKIIGESVMTNFDSCRIVLPNQPPNLDDVVLTVIENGTRQSVARDLGTGGGWTIDPAGTEIVLQGLFCDYAKEGRYDEIGVVFGCIELPPLPPPVPE
jgi:hypothetical protein